jgi:hypothetical protein
VDLWRRGADDDLVEIQPRSTPARHPSTTGALFDSRSTVVQFSTGARRGCIFDRRKGGAPSTGLDSCLGNRSVRWILQRMSPRLNPPVLCFDFMRFCQRRPLGTRKRAPSHGERHRTGSRETRLPRVNRRQQEAVDPVRLRADRVGSQVDRRDARAWQRGDPDPALASTAGRR